MTTFASWNVARRAAAAQWIIIGAFAVIAGAFFRAQVIGRETYRSRSGKNHLRDVSVEPPRGFILDRNGKSIAENTTGYSIRLIATSADSIRAVLTRLNGLLARDTIDAEAVVRRWLAAPYQPALVYASRPWNDVANILEHKSALPGIDIQPEPRRHYPDSQMVAHMVGYVGEVSANEIAREEFPGAKSSEIVGKQGLELVYDSLLRGRRGLRFVEVDVRGRMIREAGASFSVPPTAGRNVHTTIDIDLQRFIDSMWRNDPYLTGKRGAMVAMTPKGEVLAYSSFPSFNPNDFIGGMNSTEFNELRDDPNKPFYNRVIQAAYPPASPFKLAMAAMALRRGYTMESRMREGCTGRYQFGNRSYGCWKPTGHGSLTLREAIASSCDVYFYQLGQLLGADSILANAKAMGFGARAGIDLDNEARGALRESVKDYVTSRGVSTWGNGEVLNLSIGQGAHTETLINMVSFYAALSGDGLKRAPHIIAGRPEQITTDLKLSPDQLKDLRGAMVDVVNQGTATGNLAAEVGLKQFQVAGKTGSAEVTGQKQMGWFIAFAPADDPKIVVGIAVEEGIHGALVAKYPVRAIVRFLTGKTVKADFNSVTEDLTRTTSSDSELPPPPPAAAPVRKPPVHHP